MTPMTPMTPKCQTCGATDSLVELTELGFGPSHGSHALHLCRGCIQLRQAAAWPAEDPEAGEILQALAHRQAPPRERYTYLQDDQEGVRLLRLRPDWVDQRATARAG